MAQHLLNLGVPPDFAGLSPIDKRQMPPSIGNVRFKLELWETDVNFELRHGRRVIEILKSVQQNLVVSFIRPAKGPGYSNIALRKQGNRQVVELLKGRYDDLEWMRRAAALMNQCLGFNSEECDWGLDD